MINKVECLNIVGIFIDYGNMGIVCELGYVLFFDIVVVVIDLLGLCCYFKVFVGLEFFDYRG